MLPLVYNRDYGSRLVRALYRAHERRMRRWHKYVTSCDWIMVQSTNGRLRSSLGDRYTESVNLYNSLYARLVEYDL